MDEAKVGIRTDGQVLRSERIPVWYRSECTITYHDSERARRPR